MGEKIADFREKQAHMRNISYQRLVLKERESKHMLNLTKQQEAKLQKDAANYSEAQVNKSLDAANKVKLEEKEKKDKKEAAAAKHKEEIDKGMAEEKKEYEDDIKKAKDQVEAEQAATRKQLEDEAT